MKRFLAMVWALARPAPVPAPQPEIIYLATKEYHSKDDKSSTIATHVCCFGVLDEKRVSVFETSYPPLAQVHQEMLLDRVNWQFHGDWPDDLRLIGEPPKAKRPTAEVVSLPSVASGVVRPFPPSNGGNDAA